ncbi:hypothetical protein C8Q80DRAFT_1112432 [Daedaleopsis nitida]|nr:hypothetical protein C8Q80DRAFT_1112432 [Daedaleopsis nitida]
MSRSLFWPGKYYFYPIGNTSAISLSRDSPPDVPLNVLLLACGDPRNVLFTTYCESHLPCRKLDFTCCDYDSGILARNVLLLSMILDGTPHPTLWNIFFHIYLDPDAHAALVKQCEKLTRISSTLQDWRCSAYARTLRIGSDHTLRSIRRCWQYYAQSKVSSHSTRLRARELVDEARDYVLRDHVTFPWSVSASRSSGPTILLSTFSHLYLEQFKNYWKTGTTHTHTKDVAAATHTNPSFFYSKNGEGFDVHYGTDPMTPFHLAPLFANAQRKLTTEDLVKAAQSEFSDWCTAFRASMKANQNPPVVRFLLGDAIAVAQLIRGAAYGVLQSTAATVDAWTARPLELDKVEYLDNHAPTRFDVIDTSNLCDTLGYLDTLLVTVPLLSTIAPSPVLYTETLLSYKLNDSVTELQSRLFADVSAVALLLNVVPMDALSGFSTRSSSHEALLMSMRMNGKVSIRQYHQPLTWKRPQSVDPQVPRKDVDSISITVDSKQLASLLHYVYCNVFADEDTTGAFTQVNRDNLQSALLRSATLVPTRESFVALLDFVRTRLRVPVRQWSEIISHFLELRAAALSQTPFDAPSHRELFAQVIRYRVVPGIDNVPRPRLGRLADWPSIPPLVRIYLTVPRTELAILDNVTDAVPAICLQCSVQPDVASGGLPHLFQSVRAAFGTVDVTGTGSYPNVSVHEDDRGREGHSSLVASFVVPTRILAEAEDFDSTTVGMSARTTAGSVKALISALDGPSLTIFTARLGDLHAVHIVPESPLPETCQSSSSSSGYATHSPQSRHSQGTIGTQSFVHAELDPQRRCVVSFTARLDVEDLDAKQSLSGGLSPVAEQRSPCVVHVELGRHSQHVVFPLPVMDSERRLRVARKSSYIEVVVRVAIPFSKPDGMKLNPFPVFRTQTSFCPSNIHRIPLDLLPVLKPQDLSELDRWYGFHVSCQMSVHERNTSKEKQHGDVMVYLKDTIHAIMMRAMGLAGKPAARTFALIDDNTNDCDTLFFVNAIRFDLSSHTVVCDAYVLPLCPSLMPHIRTQFGQLLQSGIVVHSRVYGGEMRAWKQLLPALVERCRTAWTHGVNCEYAATDRVPQELETGEGDPLCSCGRGNDVDEMLDGGPELWKDFAPYVTRIALSPLFAVAYLEPVFENDLFASGVDSAIPSTGARKCHRCGRDEGSQALLQCSRCKSVIYCSKRCQKDDWKEHKSSCLV